MNSNKELKKALIKYAVFISLFTFVASKYLKVFFDDIINVIFTPLMGIDLNNDGKPDMEQIKKISLNIGGFQFHIGIVLFSLFKLIIQLLIIWYILTIIVEYDLIKIN